MVMPQRWQISLHVFIDAFQGCYKDGTESGTIDCRWFSAAPFIIRLILYTMYAAIFLPPYSVLCGMVFVVSAIFIIILDPYKQHFKNYSNYLTIYFLFSGSFVFSLAFTDYNSISLTLLFFIIVLLNILLVSIIFCWVISHRLFQFHHHLQCFRKHK